MLYPNQARIDFLNVCQSCHDRTKHDLRALLRLLVHALGQEAAQVAVPHLDPRLHAGDRAQGVHAGLRQRGTHIHPGTNCGIGGDDTLFALVDGVVRYERLGKKKTRCVVYPVAQ